MSPTCREEVLKGKGKDPKPNLKPSKSSLRPSKYKTQIEESVICKPIGQPDQDSSQAKIRSIPTLQIPSTLPSNLTAKQELMAWHLKLGHLPFGVIQNAARLGILPHRLTQVKDHPKCPSCLYGAAHRRSWRTGKEYSHLREAKGPGDVVSVDQLVSSVPGFIAQERTNVRYKLTKRRFKAATVFVDHFSRLSYVHIHTSTGGDEAVQAKEAFEAFAAQRGVLQKLPAFWRIYPKNALSTSKL